MTLSRFSPVSPNKWEVSFPVKSAKPVATIVRRKGRCSMLPSRPLGAGELASLLAFMDRLEAPLEARRAA